MPQADDLNAKVQAYNALRKDKGASLTQLLSALKKVFTDAYRCFNDAGVGLKLWPAHMRHAALVALEKAADEEFCRLVALCLDAEEPPMLTQPGDPQFGGPRYGECHTLWQKIVNGTTTIRVDFKKDKRLLAMIARIVDVPIGLRLIQTLTLFPGKPVVVCDYTPKEWKPFVYAAVSEIAQAQMVVCSAETGGNPDTVLLNQRCQIKTSNAPKPGIDYSAVTGPGDVWSAVLATKRGVRFTVGAATTYCDFAPGSFGCVIQMLTPAEAGDTNIDIHGNLVHTPEWLTLAHEMGHALTHISGASSSLDTLFDLYCGNATGDTQKLWTNGEEFLIITVVENEFRRYVGLTARGGHLSLPSERDIDIENTYTAVKTFYAGQDPSTPKLNAEAEALLTQYHSTAGDRRAKEEWLKAAKKFLDKIRNH